MPLGGLIPYDDEEERRRRMLTPGINPNVARLPEASMPRALPRPSTETPGGDTMPPSPVKFDQPTRLQRMDVEKDSFMRTTPGRGRSALTGALRGLGQGLASGQGLAGAVGGAIGGAAGGAINPRGLREQEFNRLRRPELTERFAAEDAEAQRVRQAEQDALNDEFKRAQIGATNRSNIPQPPRPLAPPRPITVAPGGTVLDPTTGQPMFTASPAPARDPAPRPVLNDRGEYVDFNAETKAGRKVKAFQKPKASGGGKAKKPPKVVSMTQIRQYMKATGKSRSDAIADAMRDGYRIAK